jgi:hypothetical protein
LQLPAQSQSFPRTVKNQRTRSRYRTLRRAPAPLKALLRPIWTAIDHGADLHAEKAPGSFPAVIAEAPIRPMTRSEFDALAARNPYYHGRHGYLGAAAWVAGDLIVRHDLTTALELGPNVRPLICGADVMDRIVRPGLEASGNVLLHDATATPWPIPGDRYDLFVALQVFEHLGAAQAAAFAEVRRIARHAIISLPIGWEMDDPGNPHHGISHEHVLSWFAPIAPSRVIVGNPGYRQRLIYTFENLR